MPSRIDSLLSEIAKTCAEPGLTPKDWQKLSLLAVKMHRESGTRDTETLKQLFISRGCSVHRAGFFCRQLESFWTVLRIYDEENINGGAS